MNISVGDEANVLNVIAALRKISENVAQYQQYDTIQPLRSFDMNRYWRAGLFMWFTFLFDYYYPAPHSSYPSRWETINYVSCVFAHFIKQNTRLVSSTAGTAQFATRLWLITDYDYERSLYSVYCGWWAPFIMIFEGTDDTSFQKKIYDIDAVKGYDMIDLILKRLNSSMEIENCSPQQYCHLVRILFNFRAVKPASGLVYVNRLASVVTPILNSMVTSTHQSNTVEINILDACLQYFSTLCVVLESGNSIEAVCKSIRSGLITSFIRFSPHLKLFTEYDDEHTRMKHWKPMIDRTIQIITKALPKYMTMVTEQWHTFLHDLNSKLEDTECDIPRVLFCDNAKHDAHSNPKAIFRCSGCESVWYCSEKCQRENWVDTHRYICHESRPEKSNDVATLRKRDQKSACRFAILHVKSQWETIKAMVDKGYPGIPLSQLTIVVDYIANPHKLYIREQDRAAVIAAKYIPNATVIQCYVSLGNCVGVVTTAGDIDDADHIDGKAWITGGPGRLNI
ncbi:hypothetical protein BDQ17DRAFT_1431028 [Cyathus striatus]|nr:hypothetical protein BDQ17DRAFT_1431028 [Cyathus striatus]